MNKWEDILSSQGNALRTNKRSRKAESNPFDIFPDWFKSAYDPIGKDKETNIQKDDYKTGVDNYLARKRAHKKRTPTTYNDQVYTGKGTKFSSPPAEQQIIEPTNMGEYNDEEAVSINYSDPVISTKPTPTSIKMGVPRPGPSTFIQTARYNPQTKRLNIAYTDGTIFPYENVSPELADRILKKKNYHSPGQTLLNTIFKGHGTTKADEIYDIEEGM